MSNYFPERIFNWINGEEVCAGSGEMFAKLRPADGTLMCSIARSGIEDVKDAVDAAENGYKVWREIPPVKRGAILYDICMKMRENREIIAGIVAQETGKSFKESLGETEGAIALGLFYAGEGQRLYGKTTTSGTEHKFASTIRQPVGVAGLIVAANTPIANVAWKMFPALICGNGVVMKAAEDTPVTAWIVAKLAYEAGLPKGVFNVVQGLGKEAGAPLVEDNRVGVISFTGSTAVGKEIAVKAGNRLAKVSLELGGKNGLVVCDDADLDNAVKWVMSSSFSNAGQRCASSSRIIVFDSVYEEFRRRLLAATSELKVGNSDGDYLGPVINEKQLNNMIAAIEKAEEEGAEVLCGGKRLTDNNHSKGFYMAPTIVEKVEADSDFSVKEIFGPITALYRVKNYKEALEMVNNSPYGLTASIHTKNFSRAIDFTRRVETGVAVVNAGTHGSEPHMPFGGSKLSGNGSREPGTEALDIYSDLKDIYINIDPADLEEK